LRGIKLLAFRAEELAHEQVDLLPQQFIFLFQHREALVPSRQFGLMFG